MGQKELALAYHNGMMVLVRIDPIDLMCFYLETNLSIHPKVVVMLLLDLILLMVPLLILQLVLVLV